MGPSGAFREITDSIQTDPPWRGRQEVSALNQTPALRKPGKWARAGAGTRTGWGGGNQVLRANDRLPTHCSHSLSFTTTYYHAYLTSEEK